MGFNINNWRDNMFPIVTKWFDLELDMARNLIKSVISIESTDRFSFDEYGVGGLGEVGKYDGSAIEEMNRSKGFKTTYETVERAGKYTVTFKSAKNDMSGEAKKAGTHMSNALKMTQLLSFYRMFANGFNAEYTGGDGQPLFSASHLVNSDSDETFSNLGALTFSIANITATQTKAQRFVTNDGLPYLVDYDVALISPELEPLAKEFFGKEAKLLPETAENGANPVYGMKYFVIKGFTAKQWALGDAKQMKMYMKMVENTSPMVIEQKSSNPLIQEYIGYMDYVLGWSEVRQIFGHNPTS